MEGEGTGWDVAYERRLKVFKTHISLYLILCLKSCLSLLIWGNQFVKAYDTYSHVKRVAI